MGLPPRPRGRLLVRRALVASVLTTGACDQGVKREDQRIAVPPQVAPPQVETVEQIPPQTAPDPDPVPPQVAYSNGFTLELVNAAGKPLANTQVKIKIAYSDEVHTLTTSASGDVYVPVQFDGPLTFTVEADGYKTRESTVDGGMHPSARVVLKKQTRAR